MCGQGNARIELRIKSESQVKLDWTLDLAKKRHTLR